MKAQDIPNNVLTVIIDVCEALSENRYETLSAHGQPCTEEEQREWKALHARFRMMAHAGVVLALAQAEQERRRQLAAASRCVTHHACDCLQAKLERLEAENARLHKALAASK